MLIVIAFELFLLICLVVLVVHRIEQQSSGTSGFVSLTPPDMDEIHRLRSLLSEIERHTGNVSGFSEDIRGELRELVKDNRSITSFLRAISERDHDRISQGH